MTMLQLLDLALVITLAEAGWLWWCSARGRGGLAVPDWLPNLAAGIFLMLAIRAALVSPESLGVLAGLTASGAAHGVDMRRRWLARRDQRVRASAARHDAPAMPQQAALNPTLPTTPSR